MEILIQASELALGDIITEGPLPTLPCPILSKHKIFGQIAILRRFDDAGTPISIKAMLAPDAMLRVLRSAEKPVRAATKSQASESRRFGKQMEAALAV